MTKIKRLLTSEAIYVFLIIFIFLLVEAITSSGEFFFTHLGWADHWLYLGQFDYNRLFEPAHILNYKSSRLIWVWQGSLIFKLLSYPWNNYFILIYSLFKFWIIFWLVLRQYVENKKMALLYLCIFIFYPTFRQNGGAYYHNLEASSWWLMAILVLRRIEISKLNPKFIALTGLFAGFAINTNLFFINFLPAFILLAPKLFIEKPLVIIWSIAGLAGSVLLIGILNVTLGGSFHYYLPMIEMITSFNGASELWHPLLSSESFVLLAVSLFVAIFLIIEKCINFKKTQIEFYVPLTISFLYTAWIYLFWHIRGVEVLSIDIHNSMLLLTAFLMIAEVGERFIFIKFRPHIIIIVFMLVWGSVHYLQPLSGIVEFFFYSFEAFNIATSLLFIALLMTALISKKSFTWIVVLAFIPFGFSRHPQRPIFMETKERCSNKNSFDIVFDIKKEIQKINEPMVLSNPDNLGIAQTFDFIGMHSKWPYKRYFDDKCFFGNPGKHSSKFTHEILIAHSEDAVEKGEIGCSDWPVYKKVVFKKEYKLCHGKKIFFKILSSQD